MLWLDGSFLYNNLENKEIWEWVMLFVFCSFLSFLLFTACLVFDILFGFKVIPLEEHFYLPIFGVEYTNELQFVSSGGLVLFLILGIVFAIIANKVGITRKKESKASFMFLCVANELRFVFCWAIVIGVLSGVHALIACVIFKKCYLEFATIFWFVIGVAGYYLLYIILGNTDENDFLPNFMCPRYIPIIDISTLTATYPGDENTAIGMFREKIDDYWDSAASAKKKMHIFRFIVFYVLFFGIIVGGIAVLYVVCAKDMRALEDALKTFRKETDSSYGYSAWSLFSPYLPMQLRRGELEEIIAYTNLRQDTPFGYGLCAYFIGLCAIAIGVFTGAFFQRIYFLFKCSCLKCGNVGLFDTSLKEYRSGEYYTNSTKKIDEQIGTIKKEDVFKQTKDIADVYVERTDHYSTRHTTSYTRLGLCCPFCGKAKDVSFSKDTMHETKYDHSSY